MSARSRGHRFSVSLAGGRARALGIASPAGSEAHAEGAPAPEATLARFAIVIGNNRAEAADTPSLRYADDDAVATHELLVEAGVDSWLLARLDPDSQGLHPGLTPAGLPRAADLDNAMATLSKRMRAREARGAVVELMIFYSGHGDVDRGEGFVVLEDRRLTRTMLYALLARSPAARNHVFIDACKSYFLAFDRGPGGRREPYAGAFAAEAVPAQLGNTGFVLSTSSGRDSHEWERLQAGILSYEVRSALRGAADTDGDGRVTYAELGAFLTNANQEISNARYRPEFTVRPPGKNLHQEVLRWGTPAEASVHVEAGSIGHFYVETARGVRLLDAHPAARQALELHVPAERPLFVRRNDESAEEVLVERAVPPIVALAPARPEIARRGALHLAFEQLFAATFERGDVGSYERRSSSRDLAAVAAPPPFDAAPEEGPRTLRRRIALAAGAVAIAGVAAGLVTGALALQRYERGAGASQADIARLNRSIERLDIASIACFAAAGAAGLTWAGARWLGGGTSASVAPAPDGGVMIGLARKY
jgi:hypothetical protein